jgi:hypothetical protein
MVKLAPVHKELHQAPQENVVITLVTLGQYGNNLIYCTYSLDLIQAPVAHYSPKVVTMNTADPHAQAKQEGAGYSGTAKAVVHKGQIDTTGWSKSKNR